MRETVKSKLWAKYFTDKNNSETFGNATKAAIKAYGYDNPEQYHLASITGSKNMRKYESYAQMICDMEGFGYAELLKILIGKAIKGSYGDVESLLTRLGYFEDKPKIPIAVQFNFNNLGAEINRDRKARGLPPL